MSGISLLLVVATFAVFYIVVIRPQSRRQRELSGLQDSLSLGDAVVLTSGIFGTIVDLQDDRVGVEVAEGVTITVAKGAIGIVNPPVAPTDTPTDTPTSTPTSHLEIDHDADGAAPEEKY